MGDPTQVTGTASETPGSDATNGFFGWSPMTDRTLYTVRNGWDGSAITAYATLTAYAVGKAVTSGGITYVVKTAVGAGNATAPASNASFVPIENHKGIAEVPDTSTRRKQFYR